MIGYLEFLTYIHIKIQDVIRMSDVYAKMDRYKFNIKQLT